MQKWEYKTIFRDTDSKRILIDGVEVAKKETDVFPFIQRLGNDGWELVGVVSECLAGNVYGQWTGIRYYFKRLKE